MEDDDEVAERMMRMSERAMKMANSIHRVLDLYDRSLLITQQLMHRLKRSGDQEAPKGSA